MIQKKKKSNENIERKDLFEKYKRIYKLTREILDDFVKKFIWVNSKK